MTKLYVVVIFVITMVLGSSTVFAGPDDIVHDKGFNNLYWGQTIEQVAQNYDIDFNDYEIDGIYTKYKIHKDFLYVYNVKAIPTIELYFYHDRLAKMRITFLNRSNNDNYYNHKVLRQGIIDTFGKPDIYNGYYPELKNKPHITEWNRTDTAVSIYRFHVRDKYYLILNMEDGSLR